MTEQAFVSKSSDTAQIGANLLAARTVISTTSSESGIELATFTTLSPVPMSVMLPVLLNLVKLGCSVDSADGGLCPQCGCKHRQGFFYTSPEIDRNFTVCPQCWNVWEDIYEFELLEAITARMEEQHSGERIAAVRSESSSVDMTAPKPTSSSQADGLYAL